MSELDSVFRELKAIKLCKSQYAFSRDFLGRSPSYMSHLKTTDKKPSTHVLMTLHLELYGRATHLKESDNYDDFNAKQSLISLSNKVLTWLKLGVRNVISCYDNFLYKLL